MLRNKHHIPPRAYGRPRFVLRVDTKRHTAYHDFFGYPGPKTFEAAVAILKEWWTPAGGDNGHKNQRIRSP